MHAAARRSRRTVRIFFFPPPQQEDADFAGLPQQQEEDADFAGLPQQQEDSVGFVSGEVHWLPQSQAGELRMEAMSSGESTLPELTTFPFTANAGVIITPKAVI